MPWSSVRLVKVPDAAPPYDCEIHCAGCPTAGDQAGAGDLEAEAPDPAARAGNPLAAQAATVAIGAGPTDTGPTGNWPADTGPAHTGPVGTGPAHTGPVGMEGTDTGSAGAWPRQFAQVVVEILAGVRPARQVFPWTTDRVRAQIRHIGPVLAADRRPVIKRIVTSQPTARVVEMTVVVSSGTRSRALAMRLEHVGARQATPGRPGRSARWLCTELEAA
jgi:hypothetical protein